MAVLKLDIEYDFDFDVIGVVSALSPYQLAWNINQSLKIDLVKEQDITIDFTRKSIAICNYLYREKYSYFRIIRNKSMEERTTSPGELFEIARSEYFLPELKKYDYIVLVEGNIRKLYTDEIIDRLHQISKIQLITPIDLDDIRDKDNLIFE